MTTRVSVTAWEDWDGTCFVVPCTSEAGASGDFRITLHSSRKLGFVNPNTHFLHRITMPVAALKVAMGVLIIDMRRKVFSILH